MGCVYNLNGKLFNSEIELDDFLIRAGSLIQDYPDLIFLLELSVDAAATVAQLERNMPHISKEDLETRSSALEGNADIEPYRVNGKRKDWIGVTRFLQGLRNSDGDLLFPEFRREEYWKRRTLAWKDSIDLFTPEELQTIFNGEEPHLLLSEDEVTDAIKKMEKRWEALGNIGTLIHKVLETYFGGTHKGVPIRSLSREFLINEYFPSIVDTKYVPNEVIADALDRAIEIETKLKETFGKDVHLIPEVVVKGLTNHVNEDGDKETVIGVIDLLAIDSHGNVHIIDYKTSPHMYGSPEYGGTSKGSDGISAKERTFMYLMATYERLLAKYGINTHNSKLVIVPILLRDFSFDGEDWHYTGLNGWGKEIIKDLTVQIKASIDLQNSMDELLPKPLLTEASVEDILTVIPDLMEEMFGQYGSSRDTTEEEVALIAKHIKKEGGEYLVRFKWKKDYITAKSKEALINKIRAELNHDKTNIVKITESFRYLLGEAIRNKDSKYSYTGTSSHVSDPDGSVEWFNNAMHPYSGGNWKVIGESTKGKPASEQEKSLANVAELFGMILLVNQMTGMINVVKISGHDLLHQMKLSKGQGLTGNFETDIVALNRPESMILKGVLGNAELIEAMLVLNNCKLLFDSGMSIGNITVYNPRRMQGLTADNKQLLYNYQQLTKLAPLKVLDNFKKKDILLANRYDLSFNKFKEIMSGVNELSATSRAKWGNLTSALSKFDTSFGDSEKRELLIEFRRELISQFSKLKGYNPNGDALERQDPEWLLFEMVTLAIADLSGTKFYLQLDKHDNWLDGCLTAVLKNGVQGLRVDNPGALNNPLLNSATREVTIAYQNIRSDMDREKAEIRRLVTELKQRKGFGYLKDRTFGNLVDLYKDMFDESYDDDLVLKNPWNPTSGVRPEDVDFLKHFLMIVNHNRYLDLTELLLLDMIDTNSYDFFKLPLALGSSDSERAVNGLMKTIKLKLLDLNPLNIVKRVLAKIDGFIAEEDREAISKEKGQIWEMINSFDRGDQTSNYSGRLRLFDNVKELHGKEEGTGVEFFEHNLETLLLKHIFAYSLKKNLDKVLPTLEALAMHLVGQGTVLNTKFNDDLSYLTDYIRNKIFNQSLKTANGQLISAYTGQLMSFASKLALGLSPTLVYQYLDGIWKDISLSIRKPDGTNAFSAGNLRDSYFYVTKDFFHYGDGKTKSELLNEYFGLNDMDMNTYVDRIRSGLYNLWNADSFLFRFASRPDYYNRLTLFGAHMREDGVWDAYSVKDGKLVYDWKLDKRFSLFANFEESDISPADKAEYNKLKALYYAIATLLEKEGTLDSLGNIFKVNRFGKPVALPKAYTTLLSESYKDEADQLYGYYSHEKKSLMLASLIGGMFFLMYTYWSGKKNQYLLSSGIKSRGRLVLYQEIAKDENGNTIMLNGEPKYIKYYQDKDGNPVLEGDPNSTGIPFMVWQGLFQEGIIVTLHNMARTFWQEGMTDSGFNSSKGWNAMVLNIWNNEDENVRLAYRSNIQLLIFDLGMYVFLGRILCGVLGDLLKEYKQHNKNDTLEEAALNTIGELTNKILSLSFSDMNMIDSVAGRFTNWNPFALSTMSRLYEDFGKVITGEKRLYDALINTTTATRSTKPLWLYLNPKED